MHFFNSYVVKDSCKKKCGKAWKAERNKEDTYYAPDFYFSNFLFPKKCEAQVIIGDKHQLQFSADSKE